MDRPIVSIEEILEVISQIENYDELMQIATAIKSKSDHLTQAAMQRVKQKFRMGHSIRIKDEKGDYHPGLVRGFTKNKVRVIIYNKDMKISPIDMERLEAEIVG